MSEFAWTTLPHVQKRVFRMGLAPNYGIDEASIEAALDGPTNFLFWTPRMRGTTAPLRRALARDRDRYIVATGPTTGFWGGNVRRFVEKTLQSLRTDYLDILQLHWLGVASAWREGTIEALQEVRAAGKVRAIGVSIHDRERAGMLAKESPLDSFMIRYNAAHPGAERDIFPHLTARDPAVIAYTATRWRKLLKAPRGWSGAVPTAGDCYRFCLTSPHVHVTLHAPGSQAQFTENLAALERGPLDEQEMTWMRAFGKAVHG